MFKMQRQAYLAIFLLALSANARASDWYVDASAGSDLNSGTSSGAAWKTITHALASIPAAGPDTIHVAPGTYGTALGEVFPWVLRSQAVLQGDQGSALTHIAGSVGVDVMQMSSLVSGPGLQIDPTTRVEGFTIQGGTRALKLQSNWNPVSPTLRDLLISGASVAGIEVVTFTQFAGGASPALDNVHVSGCQRGLSLQISGALLHNVVIQNSSFSNNATQGLSVSAGGSLGIALSRCRLENNAGAGVIWGGGNYGGVHAQMSNCTIAHNVGEGIWGVASNLWFTTQTDAVQCTIAYNGGIGVRMDSAGNSSSTANLRSTIIHGHADDLSGGVVAATCEVGNGEQTGSNGNFQADPRFANSPAGDFHLLSTSPCIDVGDPTLPIEPDCSRADVGAFSFVHTQSQVYCTAKLNSCGGLPSIASQGSPSASASSGYTVSASNTKAGKSALLMYSSAGRASAPFQGGTLCVAAPIRRSITVIDTTGSAGQCNGVLSIDMNAFAAGALGGNPALELRTPGTRVDCQFWGRDTPSRSLLSNALEYFVCN